METIMSEFTNNTETNTVKSSKQANVNQQQIPKKETIKAKVIKTTAAINESFDLNSNCFVLGYN